MDTNYLIIFESAELVYNSKDYTSATILYFKVIFVALDSMILKKIGKTPKDHTERFFILKKEFPYEYEKLDLFFSIYRDTYSKFIDKDTCEEIRNETKRFIERAQKIS